MTDVRDHRAIEAQAAQWLARRDAAERWGEADEEALQAWLAESAAHRVAWLRLGAAWRRTERMPALAAVDGGEMDERSTVAGEPESEEGVTSAPAGAGRRRASAEAATRQRPRRRALLAFATAAVVAAVLVAGTWMALGLRQPEGARYATSVGAREAVLLADGSRVTLNTNTRGRAVVDEKRRGFWLDEGEAYFEVAHDPNRPFVIMAGKDKITVLGTRFSVRHAHGRTEVTVVEGRVRLDLDRASGAPAVPVVVTGNEAALVDTGSVLVITKTPDQVASELSWRKGQIAFDQKTLSEIALEFNRYNHVQLVVKSSAANLRLSGNFDAENVMAFTRLAHEGLGLRVVQDGDRIVLGDD
jgi:transmembrane sensor